MSEREDREETERELDRYGERTRIRERDTDTGRELPRLVILCKPHNVISISS